MSSSPSSPSSPSPASNYRRNLAWFVAAVSAGFALILWPLNGAIWWAVFIALVFSPVHRRVLVWLKQRSNTAALLTLLCVCLIVILPLALLGVSIAQEVSVFVERSRSGELDFGAYFGRMMAMLPSWAQQLLSTLGLDQLSGLQRKLAARLAESESLITGGIFSAGQLTLDWLLSFSIMLYVLFFLLRDGEALSARLIQAVPLAHSHKLVLAEKFVKVVRATVQGNILVAMVQGFLGTVAFWTLGIQGALLWGALMAVLSLLPAVGAALVWAPVALYLLVSGALWQGVALAAWGTLVIGLVDNVLRPILVGRGTNIPDYVVLIATVGGIAVFGINGFVIGPVIAAMFLAAWDIFTTERSSGSTPP